MFFIETNVGELCVGENKKFYNSKNNNWVDAKNLTINDEFLDINFNNISIEKISIQNLDEEIDSYELLLEEPHTFFICDSSGNPILVHNFVIEIPLLIWTFGEGVAIIGLSTAAVAIGKQILNGIVKHFAKENGVDVSGFNPEVEVPNIGPTGPDPEDPEDPKKDPDKHKKEIINQMTKGTNKEPKTGGKSTIYSKQGERNLLEKDFKNIHPNAPIKTIETPNGNIYLKHLGNGLKLIRRTFSSASSNNKPTLELQQEGLIEVTKIRYL